MVEDSQIGDNPQISSEFQDMDQGIHGDVEEIMVSKETGGKMQIIPSRHAVHVQEMGLALFDHTRLLHDLDDNCRKLLKEAALIYEVPLPLRKKTPYKDAKLLVQENIVNGFTKDELNVLAAVVAFEQGQIKRKNLAGLNLSPIQERQVLTIAALLRIAIGLDSSKSQSTTIKHVEASRNGVWIIVDGPKAIVDASEAQQCSSLWTKIGYPTMKVMEPAIAEIEAIPFPEPMERPGILPADYLAEAGRKVMRYQFAEMLRHEDGTRRGEDIEALHDMRVATRRMRASFEVFKNAFKPGALSPHLKGLRATGSALGQVRDLDVFMEKAQKFLDSLPENKQSDLDGLIKDWKKQRETARESMLKYLDSENYFNFKRSFNSFVKSPGAGARKYSKNSPQPATVQELTPVLIYERLASVRSFDRFLNDPPLELLHALRIEFKKLRYTVEYFREVLGDEAGEIIAELKKIQDHLGDLNDAVVATHILDEFISQQKSKQKKKEKDVDEFVTLGGLEAYRQHRQDELEFLRDSFPQIWESFNRPEFRKKLARAISIL